MADRRQRIPLGDAERIHLETQGGIAGDFGGVDPGIPGTFGFFFPVNVIRPADLLVLRFRFLNLRLRRVGGRSVLVRQAPQQPGFLSVELPSQHITERAFFEGAEGIGLPPSDPEAGKASSSEQLDAPPVRSLTAGASRLVFRVTDEEIEYSLAGLLAACSSLELSVAPNALAPEAPAPIRLPDLIRRSNLGIRAALTGGAAARGQVPPSGRGPGGTAPASLVTAGQLTALSRSLATAARLEQQFDAETALLATATTTIGQKLGIPPSGGQIGVVPGTVAGGVVFQFRPVPQDPSPTETALELPWRLLISPNPTAGFAHRTDDVAQWGRVELWHSRLGVRVDEGDVVRVDESLRSMRTVRAIWTRDFEELPKALSQEPPPGPSLALNFTFHSNPGTENFPQADGTLDRPQFRMALNSRDRMLLVHETSNFTLDGGSWTPPAVSVDRLMLSSLGAWLSSDLRVPKLPMGPYSLQQWKHRATMGRDHEVKVVYAGFLFPFGHRASLVKVTERKFADGKPGTPAYLFQRMFIVVTEPTRIYRETRPDPATNRSLDLTMPLKSVTFRTRVTPNLDAPVSLEVPGQTPPKVFGGGFVSFPEVDGSPFLFKVVGVDVEGNVIEYGGPLLFVERDHNDQTITEGLGSVRAAYANADDRYRRHALGGQRIAYAESAQPDDTTLVTEALYWDAAVPSFLAQIPQDEPKFSPVLATARVVVPAMNALAGNDTATEVQYPAHYAQNGYAANAAEVFLELTQKPKLDFTGKADRSGGLVTPNLQVTALSRIKGPIGGAVPNAVNGTASPVDFFSGIKAKLFGLVSIPELLEAVGFDVSKFPTFASQVLDRVSALLQDLQRLREVASQFGTGVAGLTGVAADANKVLEAVDALVNQKPDPPDLGTALNTLAGSIGTLSGAVDAATALPATVRNDLSGLVRRVRDQVGRAANDATAIHDVVDAVNQFVRGTKLPDVVTARIAWSADLTPWPSGAAIFQPRPNGDAARCKLELAVEMQAPTKAGVEPTALVSCSLAPFQLRLIGHEAFIVLDFDKIEFLLAPGRKPDVNVVFKEPGGIRFDGPLSFVNTLKDLIPFDGFSDPPYLDVAAEGIKAGFDLGLPTVAVGVFSIANISLGAGVRVPFIDESLDVTFSFCTRENPFRLTVWIFGGGGFFAVTITPEKCRVLEAAFEFGAAVAIDLGVASGSIEVMAGVYFRLESDQATLTGYFRMRGEVDVLGLISACIELYLELTYEFSSGKAVGRATLTIEVEVLLLSFSVEISCEKKFKGSNKDPSFVEIMGPQAPGAERPWDEYCRAFSDA